MYYENQDCREQGRTDIEMKESSLLILKISDFQYKRCM